MRGVVANLNKKGFVKSKEFWAKTVCVLTIDGTSCFNPVDVRTGRNLFQIAD